jgi:hypothetical protein
MMVRISQIPGRHTLRLCQVHESVIAGRPSDVSIDITALGPAAGVPVERRLV